MRYLFGILVRFAFFFVLLTLVGCGSDLTTYPVPSNVVNYVNTFELLYGKSVRNVKIEFGVLPDTVLGQCVLPSQVITINQLTWGSETESEQEETVMHELGHCVLFRAHLNTAREDGTDTSLMNAYLLPSRWYSENLTYYRTELFQVSGKPLLYGVAQTIPTITYTCGH